MSWLVIFTYKQLLAVIFVTLCVLLGGVYLIVRLWVRDRFKSLEERTASLESSNEGVIYSNESETSSDEINHG